MTPEEREAQRAANKEKNARRKAHKIQTIYARDGRALRQKFGGAFGKAPAGTFNICAEGTTAVRKAENQLEEP